MGEAEDIVRARQARQAEALAAQERVKSEQIHSRVADLTQKIQAAIPRILVGLKAADYPGAKMITFGVTRRGLFSPRTETDERAGWLVYHYPGEVSRSWYLLSDERLLIDRGRPLSMAEFVDAWGGPERALGILEGVWNGSASPGSPGGLREFDEKYGG